MTSPKLTLSARLGLMAHNLDKVDEPASMLLREAQAAIDEAADLCWRLKKMYPNSPHILNLADETLSKLTRES